jgi:hypothetical protein
MKEKILIGITGLLAIGELCLGIFEGYYIENKQVIVPEKGCTYINQQIFSTFIIDVISSFLNFCFLLLLLLIIFGSKNKNYIGTVFILLQIPQIVCSIVTVVLYYCKMPCYDNSGNTIPEYWYYFVIHYVLGWLILVYTVFFTLIYLSCILYSYITEHRK